MDRGAQEVIPDRGFRNKGKQTCFILLCFVLVCFQHQGVPTLHAEREGDRLCVKEEVAHSAPSPVLGKPVARELALAGDGWDHTGIAVIL